MWHPRIDLPPELESFLSIQDEIAYKSNGHIDSLFSDFGFSVSYLRDYSSLYGETDRNRRQVRIFSCPSPSLERLAPVNRFTLCHELGHVILHETGYEQGALDLSLELICDEFA